MSKIHDELKRASEIKKANLRVDPHPPKETLDAPNESRLAMKQTQKSPQKVGLRDRWAVAALTFFLMATPFSLIYFHHAQVDARFVSDVHHANLVYENKINRSKKLLRKVSDVRKKSKETIAVLNRQINSDKIKAHEAIQALNRRMSESLNKGKELARQLEALKEDNLSKDSLIEQLFSQRSASDAELKNKE